MREIKFRAWTGKRMMEPSRNMVIDSYDGLVNWSFGGNRPEPLDCVLMQYTGLKDKNGKEIYEGDIVKYMYLNTNPIEERVAEVKLMPIGDVNRNIQAYYPFCYSIAGSYKDEKREVTECFLTPADECEIIGNIYENPELTPTP